MKNPFALVNGIPPEVLSLIPNHWEDSRRDELPHTRSFRFMRTIDQHDISKILWLAITPSDCQLRSSAQIAMRTTHRILLCVESLRSLKLIYSRNLPFIHVLNPSINPSGTVSCPKLEEVILYIKHPDQLHLDKFLSMAKERDLRGAKLMAITIVSTEGRRPRPLPRRKR